MKTRCALFSAGAEDVNSGPDAALGVVDVKTCGCDNMQLAGSLPLCRNDGVWTEGSAWTCSTGSHHLVEPW